MRTTLRRTAGIALLTAGITLAVYQLWWLNRPQDGVPRSARPLVLVTVDTLRADHLEPYGGDFETPFFTRLAERATLFEQAFSVAPITLPAHTSILTGLYPPQHGVRNNGIHAASDELHTLAERLKSRGWRTGAFVSAAVLDGRYGLDQGFEFYDDDLSTGLHRNAHTVPDRPAEATVDAALAWLDTLGADERFFLWVHLYDPHAPYSPPGEARQAHARPYAAEVIYTDSQLSRLFEHPRLALADGPGAPITAVLADHGESLGEHGEQTHALLAYDATLHVPFFLAIPGVPGGRRSATPVTQVDLLPTLLDALDLGRPGDLDDSLGRSLLPALDEGPLRPRSLYSETYLPFYTYGWAKLKVLRNRGFKYIDAPGPELFEIAKDPRELTNVIEQLPGPAHDLARDLRELEERFGDPEFENAQSLDAESRDVLRSLGYLSLAEASPGDDGERPDPKEMVDVHVAIEKARHLRGDHLLDMADRHLREALDRDPKNLAVLAEMADNLARRGEIDEAVTYLERALEAAPDSAALYLRLAALENHRRRPEKALALVDLALGMAPDMIEAHLERVLALQRLGRRDEATDQLQRSLEAHPDHPRLLLVHALGVELAAGDLERAEARLRQAVEADPFLAPGWIRLGDVQERLGRQEDAERSYRRGLERRKDDPELLARLALLRARQGAEDAEDLLLEALRLSPGRRSDLLTALGSWLSSRGRADEAAELFAGRAEPGTRSPLERNNRAIALFGLGRLDEARSLLEELVEEFPNHVDALANLASVAATQEDWEAAERFARGTLDLRPDLADPWNVLGLAAAGRGRDDQAVEAYRRALDIDPGYWQARLNLGDALLRQGKVEGAEEEFLRVVDEAPSLKEAHQKLAELYGGPLSRPEAAEKHRRLGAAAEPEEKR